MDMAYIAGLFDGEGSVGIYKVGGPKAKKVHHCVKLAVYGTHRPMIEGVYKALGVGAFSTQKRQGLSNFPRGKSYEQSQTKQGWVWRVTSRAETLEVGEILLPHLIEKREQLLVAMRFSRGEITGTRAEKLCKQAKQFEFPDNGSFKAPRRATKLLLGVNNPAATIDEKQVRKIRKLLAAGETQANVARHFGVNKHLIWRIAHGKSWASVR